MTTDPHPVASEYVLVNGLRIHYRTAGTGKRVVLVHGYPPSPYLWRNIIPSLAEIRRVIAPDLPGYGLSDKPSDASYTFEYQAEAFGRLIQVLGLDKVDLVVHDLGGPIALLWAVRNPYKVCRVAIVNTILSPEYTWKDRLLLGLMRVPGILCLSTATQYGMARSLKNMMFDKAKMTQELIATYLATYASAGERRRLLRTFTAPMNAPGRTELNKVSNKLPNLDVPVHIIYGESAPYCHEYMQRQGPVASPSAGHTDSQVWPFRAGGLS